MFKFFVGFINFNPRAHEGHDLSRIRALYCKGNFNPRAHEGHDLQIRWRLSVRGDFNPRAHEGHDDYSNRSALFLVYFNPRAHEGHDALPLLMPVRVSIFQSTCPRGARPVVVTVSPVTEISIHVPTRGTTTCLHRRPAQLNFNPRAHEGHDYICICNRYIG